MGLQLMATIQGETQLSRKLQLLTSQVKNWEPALKETALSLKDIFSNDVFETEGGAIQEEWAPLSRAYAYRKERQYPGQGILEATGMMKASFMTFWNTETAKVWNDAMYFKYHQSNAPRKKLPRRMMMKLGNAQREMVVRIFNTYFQKGLES